jgi:hypothetical protein
MIIPLYNLQAHNVMTNTVVDAGTDAKVARFQKRGLEVISLAILEPVEVWGEAPIPAGATASARTSVDGGGGSTMSHKDKESGALPPTPGSPSIIPDTPASVSSFGNHSQQQQPASDPSHLGPPSGAKKMFGKMFKKNQRPPSIALASGGDAAATSSARLSVNISSPWLKKAPSSATVIPATPPPSANFPSPLPTGGPDTPATATGVRPLVLGVQPSMSSATHPPHGRPSKYVWVVRRWLKGSEGSLLGGMMGKLSVNGKDALGLGAMGFGTSGMGQVEVRFEWSRGTTKRKRKDSKKERPSAATKQGSSGSHSRRTSMIASQSSKEHLTMPSQQKAKRLSGVSQHSASTQTGTSDELEPRQENDGDESDPEDSETPWTCTVSLNRTVPPGSARHPPLSSRPSGSSSPSAYQQQQHDQGVRLKVATLSPTPHHPKVVSMLKVPFPLPDIEVDKMVVRRRILTSTGVARPAESTGHEGLILTAEEIKDVVSCTGLWLVVREGFGGVGIVSRKGDGWKIRG